MDSPQSAGAARRFAIVWIASLVRAAQWGAGAGGRRRVPESSSAGREAAAAKRGPGPRPIHSEVGGRRLRLLRPSMFALRRKYRRPAKHGAGGWGPYPNFLISPECSRCEARSAPDERRRGEAATRSSHAKHDKARHPRKRDGELCRSYARFIPIRVPIPPRSKIRPARS